MGDYENVDVVGNDAAVSWTDSRNGRSSRAQIGRNPACEQSDAFFDGFWPRAEAGGADKPGKSDAAYLVTPCPTDIQARGTSRAHDSPLRARQGRPLGGPRRSLGSAKRHRALDRGHLGHGQPA